MFETWFMESRLEHDGLMRRWLFDEHWLGFNGRTMTVGLVTARFTHTSDVYQPS